MGSPHLLAASNLESPISTLPFSQVRASETDDTMATDTRATAPQNHRFIVHLLGVLIFWTDLRLKPLLNSKNLQIGNRQIPQSGGRRNWGLPLSYIGTLK